MAKQSYVVNVPITVTTDDLNDILVSAFEGLSTYWINKVEILPGGPDAVLPYASEYVALGGTIRIEFEDGKKHILTRAKLLKGIKLYVMRLYTMRGIDTLSEDADLILQYALFGKVIFE